MSLNDWLTLTLACVTVSLAVLAILIGLMAIWGYSGIKTEAKNIAEAEAKKKINEYLDSAFIQDKLKKELLGRVEQEASILYADLSLSGAFPQQQSTDSKSDSIAEEYPGN